MYFICFAMVYWFTCLWIYCFGLSYGLIGLFYCGLCIMVNWRFGFCEFADFVGLLAWMILGVLILSLLALCAG